MSCNLFLRNFIRPLCYMWYNASTSCRSISTSVVLFAEPLKKKKRLDPAVIRAREERKRKKLEKEIRKIEKQPRQFKPIEELEVPKYMVKNPSVYQRKKQHLSPMDEHERDLREVQWTHYKTYQHLKDMQNLTTIISSQKKALKKLREESEELYMKALECDPLLIPFSVVGPVETPPNNEYKPPDGDITDISRVW